MNSPVNASQWTIVCDFDGTIALEDVTDSLLMRFARPGWDVLEVAWREGRIDSRTCMAGQVALLDCSRSELDEHVATMAIDPDFPAFVSGARRAGMTLAIVSDGLDYVCRSILARHGLSGVPVVANRLVQEGARRWRLDFPHAASGCRSGSGTCKCARADAVAAGASAPLLVVGDGASDFCVAGRATMVFARKRLLQHCLDEGLPHRPVADFGQARALLRELEATVATRGPRARRVET